MRSSRRLHAMIGKARRVSDVKSRILDADGKEFEEICRDLLSLGSTLPADLLSAAGRAVASTKLSIHPQTVDSLCSAATECLESTDEIAPVDLVGALVSVAAACKPSQPSIRGLVGGLKGRIRTTVPHMTQQDLQRAIAALCKLKEPSGVEVQLLLDRLNGELDMLSDFALASLARTIAGSGWKVDGDFAKSLASTWRRRVDGQRGLKASVNAAVVFAVGKVAAKDVAVGVLRHANTSLDYSAFTFTELSQILWVYANNNFPPSESLWKALLSTVSVDGVATCATQTIGYAFWAAGVLSQKGHTSLLASEFTRQMAQCVVASGVRAFQPSSVSYMIWAVSLGGTGNSDCAKDFCKHILDDNSTIEAVGKFKSLELANTLAAVCSLGLRDSLPQFITVACQYFGHAAKTAPGTAANGRAFTQVAWTMVPEGGPEMDAIIAWFTANTEAVGIRSLCRMLWAVSKCNGLTEASVGQSASVVSFVCAASKRFLSSRGERIEQQDVGLLVWALGTLRLSHYELEERCCVLARGMLKEGRIDSRHLAMVLWGITSNAHRSPSAIDLIKGTISALRDRSISFDVADVAIVLWAMAAADTYDQSVFRDLLSILASKSNELSAGERKASLSKVHRAYLWARLGYGFQHSPQNGHLIAEVLEEAQRASVDARGALQTEVCQTLNKALSRSPRSSSMHLLSEVDLAPELPGLSVDAAVVDGRTGSRRLLVEVDGPHHYVDVLGESAVTRRQYNGQSVLKQHLIAQAGFRLLSVEDEKWRSLDRSAKYEFIQHEVSEVLSGSAELFPG
ncbi:hypothetical protein Pmar_PMAR007493 [Perkinsus marinus ATCC 50983]|uniref:RAP domain-containing protein n=1 Tax=Perkinsus marinus (strain ATCC 50983 / TXsc) TaxID=423536 RepID=C5M065_PERM5|nr:hypothetical protein Pmar_PMAR007493 [Perkinsus marinus ATCC 50983]EEQ97643.1 hypothetical protein Pmar_PMAR007493 [Perkinsus marinus ATCC 50983]|eukprot:XP_002764926.1 hypothetical protein Pmar_PMAR007493 [Perkinsus marinus ATCC 50983]